jgi:hypothetical protein
MKVFERAPQLWHVDSLVKHCDVGEKIGMKVSGSTYWVPARPEGSYYSFSDRLNLAWKVFTGKADAVYWGKAQ